MFANLHDLDQFGWIRIKVNHISSLFSSLCARIHGNSFSGGGYFNTFAGSGYYDLRGTFDSAAHCTGFFGYSSQGRSDLGSKLSGSRFFAVKDEVRKTEVKTPAPKVPVKEIEQLNPGITPQLQPIAPLPATALAPTPSPPVKPAVNEAFLRTKIAAEYDSKYPVWKPGQEVSVFRSGIGTRGMLVNIGETSLILSLKSKQIEIPFAEMDFKSKLQADAAFREKAIDIAAKKAFSAQEAPKAP